MRIDPDGASAQLLRRHGVSRRELTAARVLVFGLQTGSGLTLPLPFLGPTILIKRKWLVYDADNELEDSESIKLLRHEFCHVRQILDWGSFAYIRRHLWARVKTRSILAKSSPEERDCYWAHARVEAYYRLRDAQ